MLVQQLRSRDDVGLRGDVREIRSQNGNATCMQRMLETKAVLAQETGTQGTDTRHHRC